ncbi:FecCD family ABC transporter permease [Gorillibacterium timonense]|uniref:FecCD family ABC transporter permease n=1 Tax=Gorillibacterium timonense TaxID=1689269 RepID=UPI00071DB994|nr:iron ABC transporter permease [Gorillibacterium timonense]
MHAEKRRLPFGYLLTIGFLALIGMFALSLLYGAADSTFRDVWLALTTKPTEKTSLLIREFRLPRELAALAVGSALAVSGAIMQGMTRNPLADPGLLGLTAGANAMLAVVLAFYPGAGTLGIMLACFLGAGIGTLLVFGISAMNKGGFSPLRIVLAGAAVSALLTAISEAIGITFKISQEISLWNAGGVIGTTWKQLAVITPFIAVGILVALLLSRQLTVLSLSEEVASGLGQNTARIKIILFVVIIILAGASVALVGNLAFIGLMVPHMVRAVTGPDYRKVVPISALTGAVFMLLADTVGRTINAPYETSVTAIVAMLGLPFFLWIVNKKGGGAS